MSLFNERMMQALATQEATDAAVVSNSVQTLKGINTMNSNNSRTISSAIVTSTASNTTVRTLRINQTSEVLVTAKVWYGPTTGMPSFVHLIPELATGMWQKFNMDSTHYTELRGFLGGATAQIANVGIWHENYEEKNANGEVINFDQGVRSILGEQIKAVIDLNQDRYNVAISSDGNPIGKLQIKNSVKEPKSNTPWSAGCVHTDIFSIDDVLKLSFPIMVGGSIEEVFGKIERPFLDGWYTIMVTGLHITELVKIDGREFEDQGLSERESFHQVVELLGKGISVNLNISKSFKGQPNFWLAGKAVMMLERARMTNAQRFAAKKTYIDYVNASKVEFGALCDLVDGGKLQVNTDVLVPAALLNINLNDGRGKLRFAVDTMETLSQIFGTYAKYSFDGKHPMGQQIISASTTLINVQKWAECGWQFKLIKKA